MPYADHAFEELLRLLTVVHTGRRRAATEDVEIGGVLSRAGEGVMALLRRFPELRPAVPVEKIPFRDEMVVYGVHALPVRWDTAV